MGQPAGSDDRPSSPTPSSPNAGSQQGAAEADRAAAAENPARSWQDSIEARFAKMNRVLDGEDVSSMTAGALSGGALSNSLLATAAPRRAIAEEAMALLAHRAGAPIGDCDNAEQAASRVRTALERPLREEIAQLKREQARREEPAGGATFRERLVIEAGETLARAVAQGDHAGLAAAVARVVDRVRLLHAED